MPTSTPQRAPQGIVRGPDGNLWFTEWRTNTLWRITLDGVLTEYVVPSTPRAPLGIAVGGDRNLWFTDAGGRYIGRRAP